MLRSIKLAATAIVALTLSSPASAQMVCGDRVEIIKALENGHEEQKTASALSGNGGLVELYTATTGSWTLLLTLPGGPTCLMGSGEEWESWRSLGDRKERRATAGSEIPDHT